MERWRDVPGHEGYYEVSDAGRVRSVARRVWVKASAQAHFGYYRPVAPRFLRSAKQKGERYRVTLWKEHQYRVAQVHVLVLEAFVGPRPDGLYGCHRDDDTANNTLGNLYWGTPKQNSDDKVRNGHQPYGLACTAARVDFAAVRAIRASTGLSQDALGRLHGLSQPQISRIRNFKHRKYA